jgi:putative inorganic carbon (hco3(-)) transporter
MRAMASPRFSLDNIAFYLAFGTAVSMLFSIAVSEILLALALAALLLSHTRLRFPPILLPLGLFFAASVIAMLASVNPESGRPGLRKFLVFFVALVVYSTVRTLPRVRALLGAMIAVMALSAAASIAQFAHKVQLARQLHRPFYAFYLADRITGFAAHWMILNGQEMMLILMGAALLFFSLERRWIPWMLLALGVIFVSLVLGWTRSVWLGTFCGGVYLVWLWKRWWVMTIPAVALAIVLANPLHVGERVRSAFEPHGYTDSNAFRVICRRTGWRMIEAHPWLGLGPEQVKVQFMRWIPSDVPRPLPAGAYIHLHNLYLQYAAERGIPALLVFLWMLGKILWDWVRAVRETRDRDLLAILHGSIAAMIGVLVVGWEEVNLGETGILIPFLAIVSCAYFAIDVMRERAAGDTAPAAKSAA